MPNATKPKTKTTKKAPKKTSTKTALKTIKLDQMFAVPVLQLAYIAVADNRIEEMATRLEISAAQITTAAQIVHALSKTQCFFCADVRSVEQQTAGKAGIVSNAVCACLAPLRRGYREHVPHWQDLLRPVDSDGDKRADMRTTRSVMEQMVFDNELRNDSPVYSNECVDCNQDFTITVSHVLGSLKRHGMHTQARRCRADAQKMRERGKPMSQTTQDQSRGEAPPSEHQKRRGGRHHRKGGGQGLTASIGEQLAVKSGAEDSVETPIVASAGEK